MAASNGQRVAAFFLALLFLTSTVGATAYVVYQINNQGNGIVDETDEQKAIAEQIEAQREAEAASDGQQPCGQATYAAVDVRSTPEVVSNDPVSDLVTVDVKEGEGEEVQPGDCVAALYYGTLAADGTRFDGNYATGQPIEFSLDPNSQNTVIAGWQQGIPGMKVGGVRRIVIPADLAYGAQERGGIPANSDLVFEVEIISTRRFE